MRKPSNIREIVFTMDRRPQRLSHLRPHSCVEEGGATAPGAPGDDTLFRVELPALEQWRFTQAEAARITRPVLAVLGADSHALWPGWVEVHYLVQTWWPQAEAFVLKGATHGLQIIDPQNMAAALAAFFARHPLADRP